MNKKLQIVICLFLVFQSCFSQVNEFYADGLFVRIEYKFKKKEAMISVTIKNVKNESLYIPGNPRNKCCDIAIAQVTGVLKIKFGSDMESGNYLNSSVYLTEFRPDQSVRLDTILLLSERVSAMQFRTDFWPANNTDKGGEYITLTASEYYSKARMFTAKYYVSGKNKRGRRRMTDQSE